MPESRSVAEIKKALEDARFDLLAARNEIAALKDDLEREEEMAVALESQIAELEAELEAPDPRAEELAACRADPRQTSLL